MGFNLRTSDYTFLRYLRWLVPDFEPQTYMWNLLIDYCSINTASD